MNPVRILSSNNKTTTIHSSAKRGVLVVYCKVTLIGFVQKRILELYLRESRIENHFVFTISRMMGSMKLVAPSV